MSSCPNCEIETTESQAFCGKCGTSLNDKERRKKNESSETGGMFDGIHVTEVDGETDSEIDLSSESTVSDKQLNRGGRKTNITLGLVVSYGVGGLTILVGTSEFISGFLSGLFMLMAGLFVFPPVRRRFEDILNVQFSRWVVFLIFILIYGAGAFLNAATRAAVS